MQLEAYLDFVGPDEIRLRGHRIGIEHVIEHFKTGYSPEQITEMFPGVGLEQVYAAITYYLHRRADMDIYLERQRDRCEQQYQAWAAQPSPAIARLRRLHDQRRQRSA
jgi:uncharacterized protein (DUF433 family)